MQGIAFCHVVAVGSFVSDAFAAGSCVLPYVGPQGFCTQAHTRHLYLYVVLKSPPPCPLTPPPSPPAGTCMLRA